MWCCLAKTILRVWSILLVVALVTKLATGVPPKVCPIYCDCNLRNNLNHADCSGKRLISPNIDVPHEVQSLDLSCNEITVLDNNCFQGYVNLINISIAHNAIHTIFLDVFAQLKRIRAIDLSYNRLESIDSRLFESNRKLQTLTLEGNKFMSLSNVPLLQSKSLRTLNLANAQINVFLSVHYSGLPNLQHIELSNNLIITIDEFAAHAPSQLLTLNLEENHLNCDQALLTAIEQLKERNIEVAYSYCQSPTKGASEQKFERMELLDEHLNEGNENEDVGDSQENFDEATRSGVLNGWHFPASYDDEDDYYSDFNADENEENDTDLAPHNNASLDEICRVWCNQQVRNTFFDGIDGQTKQYSDIDLLFVFICGIAVGMAVTIFIGSCIVCIWRCSSLKTQTMQAEDIYVSQTAHIAMATPATSRTTVDAIRRTSAREPEPMYGHLPVVSPQPPRRRQPRPQSARRAVIRHDQLAQQGADNFLSRLFGRPARHQYYRTINENTATLIRRFSRSNLFTNRLSQHFDRNRESVTPNTPDSPDGTSAPNLNNELEVLTVNATRTPHRRRPETPPPLYSEIVAKKCEQIS